MASDAVRLLEIQLEVHKRSLHEKAQRIDELEARNIDLEAQVDHLKEVVAKQQTQSKDRIGPLSDLNSKRESDRGLEPETGSLPSKRRRLSPQEVAPLPRSRASNSNHHASHSGAQRATVDVRNPDDRASQPPVRQRQPHQSPNTGTQPPEPAQEPPLPRRETLGSGSRVHHRVEPSAEPYPVEDPGSESDPSYEPEDEDDGHKKVSRRRFSPHPALAARLAGIETFAHGVVAEELLSSTAERQTVGRRLNCKGSGTVVCRLEDGTDFLFPTRKLHPLAPGTQGAPGLFFSALPNEWMLSGTHQVCVCLTPGKYKYMGRYTLQKMHRLGPEEFQSLPRGTKSHWGDDIMRQKKYGSIRKDIHRRGIHGRHVDTQDVITAYEQGEEKLFVWRMKCIGFDHDVLCQAAGLLPEEGHC